MLAWAAENLVLLPTVGNNNSEKQRAATAMPRCSSLSPLYVNALRGRLAMRGGHRIAYAIHGLTTGTPQPSKSTTLRVTTLAP